MKHQVFALAVGLISIPLTASQVPMLDLTVPVGPAGAVESRVSKTGPLHLEVAFVDLPDRTYFLDEPFQYEVEVKNPTQVPITIPWSIDPGWLRAEPEARFEGAVALLMGNGVGPDRPIGGTSMYGDAGTPTSVHTMNPGTSIHLRAIGSWSGAGVNFKPYLAATDGRIYVKAVYRLHTGTLLATTRPSEGRNLTLAFPQ